MRPTRITYIAAAFVVAVMAAGVALSARPAAAATDVSGNWSVSFALSCTGNFTQSGENLTASVDCGADIALDLSGTFDAGAGTFSLTGDFVGYTVNVNGSVSPNGSALSGTWSAPPIVSEGPFSAARNGGGSASDLTGTWGITVDNLFAGDCTASIVQESGQLTADVACRPGPSNTFTGTLDQDAGTFTMTGPFNQFNSLAIGGTLSADGNSFEGTWFIDPAGPGGVLTGERTSGGPAPTPTRVRAHPTATAAPIVLPPTGQGAAGGGPDGWVFGAIAAALALSAASYVALRRVR